MDSSATPKVSVIVPFYQVERYIGQCARSLMEQTYQDIEFLFVDDGCTDRSRDILTRTVAEFPEREGMVRIIGGRHVGVPMVKIDGIKAATGDYLIFVDSDDFVEDTFIEHLVQAALKEDADVTYCDCFKEYENKPAKTVREGDFSPSDGPHAVDAIHNDIIRAYMCNKLVRRELYSPDGFVIPPYAYQEDVAILSQVIYKARKCFHLDEALYHYRRRRKGALTAGFKRKARSQAAVNMLTLHDSLPKDEGPLTVCGGSVLLRAGWHSLSTWTPKVMLDHPDALKALARQPFIINRRFGRTKQGLIKFYAKVLCAFIKKR